MALYLYANISFDHLNTVSNANNVEDGEFNVRFLTVLICIVGNVQKSWSIPLPKMMAMAIIDSITNAKCMIPLETFIIDLCLDTTL